MGCLQQWRVSWRAALGHLCIVIGLGMAATVPLGGGAEAASLAFEVEPLRSTLTLAIGERHTGAIEVENTGGDPLRVRAQLADWYLTEDGVPQFPGPGQVPRSMEGWLRQHALAPHITLTPAVLELRPGERGYFRYTFTVPSGAESYWAAVLIEEAPGADAQGGRAAGVIIRQRYASLIYVNTLTATYDLAIIGMQVALSGRALVVDAALVNRGTGISRASGRLALRDEAGKPVGPEIPFDIPVLPGARRQLRLTVDVLPPDGRYTAEIVYDYGGRELRGGRKRFEIRRSGGEPVLIL